MIIRYGGGNKGIKEYLEDGRKVDRHFTRDELDVRVTIEGDLDVTQSVIDSIPDKGQQRYLHISLSFNEPDVTEEKLAEVFQLYKKELMAAYQDDEYNIYAEIHWPKIKEVYNPQTDQMEPRYPHIHVVVPKKNLLTGGYFNPSGMHDETVKYRDAIQEKLNRENGLSSPRESPRIGTNHYEKALARYKDKELGSKNGDIKQQIYERVISGDIRSVKSFESLLAEFGEVKTRNENKEGQYFAVKVPGDDKFTNLKGAIFSRNFIETRALVIEPITDAQVARRVQTWRDIKSREIKYISNASAKVKKEFKSLNLEGQRDFLSKREEYYVGRYRKGEPRADRGAKRPNRLPRAPAGNYKPSNIKLTLGITPKEPSHLHELRTSSVDHFAGERGVPDRLFLSGDENHDVQHVSPEGHAGLRHNPYSGSSSGGRGRGLTTEGQSSVVTSLLAKQLDAAAQEMDSEEIAAIRQNLSPKSVLGFCQAAYGLDASQHAISYVKDGSARIRCGKYRYNVSDFLTKFIKLEWHEAAPILKDLYKLQEAGTILGADDYKEFKASEAALAAQRRPGAEPIRPEAALAYAQIHFGLDPDDHPITKAKDRSPRIKCGKFNYTPSDFFTKFIGLTWPETKAALTEIRNLEASGKPLNPKPKEVHVSVWREFREKNYPQKISSYNELKSSITVSSGLQSKVINAEYYARRRSISQDPHLTYEQRHLMRSMAVLEKLQKLEALNDSKREHQADAVQLKYPFSRLFADYSLNTEVVDMKLLDEYKKRYRTEPTLDSEENFIGLPKPIGVQNLPTGRAAMQRAKLIQRLHKQDRTVAELKIKIGDLQPKPLKTGGVAFDDKKTGHTVFVNHPDKVTLNRSTTPDEVAVGMIYAIERFGSPLEIHGTKEFIEQCIYTAAERDMDITFSDEAMNRRLNEVRVELGMNPLAANTMEVESLKLDASLPLTQAIDKALLESRVTELRAIQATPMSPEYEAVVKRSEALVEKAAERRAELIGGAVSPERARDIAAADLIDYSQMEGFPPQQALALIIGENLANPIYREQMENSGLAELFLTVEAAQFIEKSKVELAATKAADSPDVATSAEKLSPESLVVDYFKNFEDNSGLPLETSLTHPLIVKHFASDAVMKVVYHADTSDAGRKLIEQCMDVPDFRQRFKENVIKSSEVLDRESFIAHTASPGYVAALAMIAAAETKHGAIEIARDDLGFMVTQDHLEEQQRLAALAEKAAANPQPTVAPVAAPGAAQQPELDDEQKADMGDLSALDALSAGLVTDDPTDRVYDQYSLDDDQYDDDRYSAEDFPDPHEELSEERREDERREWMLATEVDAENEVANDPAKLAELRAQHNSLISERINELNEQHGATVPFAEDVETTGGESVELTEAERRGMLSNEEKQAEDQAANDPQKLAELRELHNKTADDRNQERGQLWRDRESSGQSAPAPLTFTHEGNPASLDLSRYPGTPQVPPATEQDRWATLSENERLAEDQAALNSPEQLDELRAQHDQAAAERSQQTPGVRLEDTAAKVELAKASDKALFNLSQSFAQIQRESNTGDFSQSLRDRAAADVGNLVKVESLDKTPHAVAMMAKNMANPDYADGVKSALADLRVSGFDGVAKLSETLEKAASLPTPTIDQIEIMQGNYYQSKLLGEVSNDEPSHEIESD